MKGETRANLIFILLLIPVLAPGAIILARKSYDTGTAPLAAPPATRAEYAYNDPWQRPPGQMRIVPEKTGRFVAEQARQRFAVREQGQAHWFKQVISSARGFEVLAAANEGDGTVRLGVLSWNPVLTEAAAAARWTLDGRPLAYRGFEAVDLPEPLRQELVKIGFVRPPKQVGWYELALEPARQQQDGTEAAAEPARSSEGRWVVRVAFEAGDERFEDACVVLLPPGR